jgi:hypothetical protein
MTQRRRWTIDVTGGKRWSKRLPLCSSCYVLFYYYSFTCLIVIYNTLSYHLQYVLLLRGFSLVTYYLATGHSYDITLV